MRPGRASAARRTETSFATHGRPCASRIGFRYVTLEGTIEIIDDQATAQANIAALDRRYHAAAKAKEMARDVFAPQERVSLLLHVDRADVHGFDGEE